MRSCYGKLTGHSEYIDIVKCDMLIIDIIASVISIAVSLIILFVLIMLLTQKKRLMKKTSSPKKEKALLCARLVLLIPLLSLSVSLPYILGAVMGYPGFGYQKVWAWGGQSAVVMGLILDVLFILLIITSIKQYILKKRNN